MIIFVIIMVLVLLNLGLGKLLVRWLAGRKSPVPEYSPEEIIEEMKSAFVERESVSFFIELRTIPVFLNLMSESVNTGFSQSQVMTLQKRMMRGGQCHVNHATFPVQVEGVSSDLEFQWERQPDDVLWISILATEPVVRFAKVQLEELSLEIDE